MATQGLCPGIEPRPNIHLIENHDQAYWIWRDAGLRHRVLVHLDAHDDMLWLDDQATVNIANFICQALKESIVKEIFWVVPHKTCKSFKYLKPVVRRLKKILAKYPGARQRVTIENNKIFTNIFGANLTICRLDKLPRFTEPVLLDIDVDYLVISRACSESDQYQNLPWCWPEDLVEGLQSAGLCADVVTIAYSIEGGYTPLKWKYFGDELAERLGRPGQRNNYILGMNLIREGALAGHRKEMAAAESNYLKSAELMADHPAPYLHLSFLYAEQGFNHEAQRSYRQAITLDPSYRTAYNSAGIWYYYARRYREAEQEHRRTLVLDARDPYAHLGQGKLAAKAKRWDKAETWLRQSVELDDCQVDAWRILGKVLAKQRRHQEAIEAYEKSLQLSLKGYLPIRAPIFSYNDRGLLLDPDHFHVHTILGKLYALQKESKSAILCFKMGIAGGDDGSAVRSRLAWIYLKQGQWSEARQEILAALKKIPRDCRIISQQTYYRVFKAFKANLRKLKIIG